MKIKFNWQFLKVACLLQVPLLFIVFSGVGQSQAMFSDLEKSIENSFLAGDLDFELAAAPDKNLTECLREFERPVVLGNYGNALRYEIRENGREGALCDFIKIDAYLGDSTSTAPVCSGDLAGFQCGPFEAAASSTAEWIIKTRYKPDAPNNAACDFTLEFNGWQARHMAAPGGYHLARSLAFSDSTVACAPALIINKVYYAPDCAHSADCSGGIVQNEWKNEWVELYNPGDEAISLKDWTICDNAVCQKVLEDKIILAKGYALIGHDPATWSLWDIPATTTLAAPLSGIASEMELSNTADMLQLKNPDGILNDQMNWGTPDLAWPNYTAALWNPGVVSAPAGHYLGRKPSGFDTDQPTDWFDYASPVVTITGVGSTMWVHWQTYTVTWIATNPSGPDSDLLIDLVYYKDTNYNGKLDATDQKYVIAAGLPNTGSYRVYVDGPINFYGYVWVKVVARNVENFMVQAQKYSVRIYEPDREDILPPEIVETDSAAPENSTSTQAGGGTPAEPLVEPALTVEENATTTDTGAIAPAAGQETPAAPETPAETEIPSAGADTEPAALPETGETVAETDPEEETRENPETPAEAPASETPDSEAAAQETPAPEAPAVETPALQSAA